MYFVISRLHLKLIRYFWSDLTPLDTEETFNNYLIEAYDLRNKYENDIELLIGLETDYITDLDLNNTKQLIDNYAQTNTPIEYIVGSVHHAFETPIDFDKSSFDVALTKTDTKDKFYVEYYTKLKTLIMELEPEVIGHIDLIRLYEPHIRLEEYKEAWKLINEIVEYVANYGGLIEINAAAIRKGWGTPYPASDILMILRQHNAKLTLSDDTHSPENVGLNYWRVFEYLKSHDITCLWYLKRCEVGTIGAGKRRRTIACKYEGAWSDDIFWKTCNPSWH